MDTKGESLKILNPYAENEKRKMSEDKDSKLLIDQSNFVLPIESNNLNNKNIYNPAPVLTNQALDSNLNKTRYGPPGANLFIFHLPNDWTEVELTN